MEIPRIINKSRFYAFEEREFPREFSVRLSKSEAKRFVRKACKHFKVAEPALKFHARRKHTGSITSKYDTMRIGTNPTVGLLSHELAHVFSRSGHSKRCLAMLEKIILYARKKGYWQKHRWAVFPEKELY